MGAVSIGILDSDREYVEKLAAYLNRYGRELWKVAGFTDDKVLQRYMKERGLDLLIGTGRESMKRYKERFPDACYVWLADNRRDGKGQERAAEGIYSVYRYQSAKAVGQAVMDIVEYRGIMKCSEKKSAVIYSPVGRCGKTTLAMQFVEDTRHGRWLYLGMEDYSYLVDEDKYAAEDFLYYVKERREDAVIGILRGASGIIPSPFSPFDTRQIGMEDVKWFLDVFERDGGYGGVLFDIGTGVLQSLNVLLMFDHVVVPYLCDRPSVEKRQQFEELIKAYELEDIFEKIHYIDMGKDDPMKELQVLLT